MNCNCNGLPVKLAVFCLILISCIFVYNSVKEANKNKQTETQEMTDTTIVNLNTKYNYELRKIYSDSDSAATNRFKQLVSGK